MSTKPRKSPRARGHNPDRLTVTQVGKGWRLLTEKEIAERKTKAEIQCWGKKDEEWLGGYWIGNYLGNTYRTRRPAGYFLPKKGKR